VGGRFAGTPGTGGLAGGQKPSYDPNSDEDSFPGVQQVLLYPTSMSHTLSGADTLLRYCAPANAGAHK
ncbi:MAG TPA: hypothetical protein PLP40_10160, partial [Trichococcus flocculiformis]|nr:hypothetical protein [Trichococcus flocculiformis]